MSAVDDILEMKKQAAGPSFAAAGKALKGFGGHIGNAFAAGAGTAVAGAGVAGAGLAAAKVYDAMTKARDFKSMMRSSFNEDLHEMYAAKPKQFNEAYSSLRSFNPSFSKDPMVAGLYMRQMMDARPEGAAGVLTEALRHREEMPESPIRSAILEQGTRGAVTGYADSVKGKRESQLDQKDLKLDEAKTYRQHDLAMRKTLWDQFVRKQGPAGAIGALTEAPHLADYFRGESDDISPGVFAGFGKR